MKGRFEVTHFHDLLTYLKTIRAKVVMFGIKPKLMKCRFEVTHFYDLLTYLGERQLLERRIHDKIMPGFFICPTFQGHRVQVHLGQVI
jgi:hypothetical protein